MKGENKVNERNDDRLQRLARLSVVERIEAAERYYRQHDERFADGLKHAAEIAAPDGWQHIAPAWTKPNAGSDWRGTRTGDGIVGKED